MNKRNKLNCYKIVIITLITILLSTGLGVLNICFAGSSGGGTLPPEEPDTDYYFWDISGMWTVEVNMTEWADTIVVSGASYSGTMTLNPDQNLAESALGSMNLVGTDGSQRIIPITSYSATIENSPYDFIHLNIDSAGSTEAVPTIMTPDGTEMQGVFSDPNSPQGHSILWSWTAYGQARKIFLPIILKPEDKIGGIPISYLDKIPLDRQNYTATADIPFKAKLYGTVYTGEIKWDADLVWFPSPNRSKLREQRMFITHSDSIYFDEEHNEKYLSMGGELYISAKANLQYTPASVLAIWPSGFSSGYIMITGPEGGIPENVITSKLIELYQDGATQRLMTGIAEVESSYWQFYKNNVNYPGLWMPRVSDDNYDGTFGNNNDGSHVGLMQMPTTMAHAWNWQANVEDGVSFFKTQKLPPARRNEIRIINEFKRRTHITNENIQRLTGEQLENMALTYYCGYGSGDIDKQYYILVEENGKGVWRKNKSGNPKAIEYADKVRKLMK